MRRARQTAAAHLSRRYGLAAAAVVVAHDRYVRVPAILVQQRGDRLVEAVDVPPCLKFAGVIDERRLMLTDSCSIEMQGNSKMLRKSNRFTSPGRKSPGGLQSDQAALPGHQAFRKVPKEWEALEGCQLPQVLKVTQVSRGA